MKAAPPSPLTELYTEELLINIIQVVQQAAVQTAQQQVQQEVGPVVQQSASAAVVAALARVEQLIKEAQDGFARQFACQRNSLLCMGSAKGDVPLK